MALTGNNSSAAPPPAAPAAGAKSGFLDKVLGRIDRLHGEGLQAVVQRLARERRFLEMLFDAIEDGVLVADSEGRIAYFNRAATRLVGVTRETAESHGLIRFLPGLDWDKVRARGMAGEESVWRQEFEVSYPRSRYLRLYGAPLEGGSAGKEVLVLILHDATEARQKTFEAIESERIQALTLLAASVAHEIGNPLNALNIHTQLMERELRRLRARAAEGPAPGRGRGRRPAGLEGAEAQAHLDRLQQFLGVAKGEIARLDYIVTQFLQAIRPVPPRFQPCSINTVAASTLELLGPELENRGLTVSQRLADSLPMAPLDPAQIQQVLVNLIKNAMQSMTRGGVLTLQTGTAGDGVWVSVEDTGGGIAPEMIHRIFEPYYTTKQRGTGLGLMIVQRIVREHHGRIDIQSRVGHGTAFRVWLPAREPGPPLLEERLDG